MKIYTLTGDDGTTSLSGGKRVPKHALRIEACGSVDELIAWIGLLRDCNENSERKELLIYIQDQLMRCAALLTNGKENRISEEMVPNSDSISLIEKEIDKMEDLLTPLNSFILPGGNILVSNCHIARCVCRRAERAVSRLNEAEGSPEVILKFLNRLSDFLFVLSRIIGLELDSEEIKWPV